MVLAFLASSCNVYKSDGRKNLESLGPPPGSIKTNSVKLLLVNSAEQNASQIFHVCKVEKANDNTCAQDLLCTETSLSNLSVLPDSQNAVDVDQNLLIDKGDPQKTFESALICTSSV